MYLLGFEWYKFIRFIEGICKKRVQEVVCVCVFIVQVLWIMQNKNQI